jgi:drug/metabolite transporter (DMT)-like permease
MAVLRAGGVTARPLAHWLMLFSITLLWGSSPAMNKVAVAALEPIDVVAIRLTLAALLLWLVVLIQGRPVQLGRRHLLFFVACGFTGNALPFFAITWGQTQVPASLTTVFFAVMPLATILLAHFLVEGERLTRWKAVGFVLGFFGILVLVGPEILRELGGAATLLVYELAILGGALCYSINVIVSRNRPPGDVVAFAACAVTASALMTLPAAIATGLPEPAELVSTSGLAVLGLAVLGTALPTVIMLRLVTAAGAGFLALINYMIPVYGYLLGVIVLAEPVELRAILALATILAGVTLSERRRRIAG